jgi:hypothetical protein
VSKSYYSVGLYLIRFKESPMKIRASSIKNIFASMSSNNIINEKCPYIKSNQSNFRKDFWNLSGDSKAVLNDLKKTIEKNKEYLYG